MTAKTTATNPVVKSTPLNAYPGWTVRQYADGMYDAAHTGPAVSPGFETFREAVAHARWEANGQVGPRP